MLVAKVKQDPRPIANLPEMRCDDALRQLLTYLAAVDDTDTGQQAADEADEILALISADPEAAGAVMLAMGSFIVYGITEEPDPYQAVEALTTSGDRIDHFRELLEAFLDAYTDGQRISQQTIRIAVQITQSRDDTALVLWILGTYLAYACQRGPDTPEHFIGEFVASCVRQELVPSRPLQAGE